MNKTKTTERERVLFPWSFEPNFDNRWRKYTPEECGMKNNKNISNK